MITPFISILTTVYNREKYLTDCIESVLASSFQDWEMIIVDDGSTDNSVAIAKEYEKKEGRIKVYVNETNLGQFENRNFAATLANGSYIKYLDSDDTIYPHGLEIMVNTAKKYPEAGLIISHDKLHEEQPYPIAMNSIESYEAFFFNKGFPCSGPSASLIKKKIFLKIKGFPKPYYVGTDVLLWLKIAQISTIVKIQPALNWYRQHDGQEISKGLTSNEYFKNDYNYYYQYLTDASNPLSEENKKKALALLKRRQVRRIVKYFIKTGNILETYHLIRYNKLSITDLKNIF